MTDLMHLADFQSVAVDQKFVRVFNAPTSNVHLHTPPTPVALAKTVALSKNLECDDRAFFIMNVGKVVEQYEQWRRLMTRIEPYYAVKCNNDPLLLRVLADLGTGFDCASKGEIDQVLSLGVPAERIIFANPCKTRNYIRYASNVGVKAMTFDNQEELVKVAALHPDAQMILRIAVSDDTAQCPLNIKFGAEPVNVAPALLQVARELNVNVVGISFHVGSGCRDPTAYAVAIAHCRRLFDLGAQLGHSMDIIDIGGGFPGSPNKQVLFEKIADVVNASLDNHFASWEGNRAGLPLRVIAEPGRYFASAAYTLIVSVMAKTAVPANRITLNQADADLTAYMYYINDGVYGSFNCVLYDHAFPEGEPLFPNDDNDEHTWAAVWGPTCDGLDLVMAKCRLPRLQDGDWMRFDNMGAYTVAAGSEFNGFPRPQCFYFADRDVWSKVDYKSTAALSGGSATAPLVSGPGSALMSRCNSSGSIASTISTTSSLAAFDY